MCPLCNYKFRQVTPFFLYCYRREGEKNIEAGEGGRIIESCLLECLKKFLPTTGQEVGQTEMSQVIIKHTLVHPCILEPNVPQL